MSKIKGTTKDVGKDVKKAGKDAADAARKAGKG